MNELTCRQPDADCPKLLCGHPLPCPLHTATIDLTTEPPSVVIPITATAALRARGRLAKIASILERGIGDQD